MLTATQISNKTGINLDSVRYRLSKLRRTGKVSAKRIGQTYVYGKHVIDKVKSFDEEKNLKD